MTIFVSFTSTFKAFVDGAINPKAEDAFAFGVRRDEIFEGTIPMAVTWNNLVLAPVYGRNASDSEVDPDVKQKWDEFLKLLSVADSQDRITWQVGNYSKYCANHPDAVWYRG